MRQVELDRRAIEERLPVLARGKGHGERVARQVFRENESECPVGRQVPIGVFTAPKARRPFALRITGGGKTTLGFSRIRVEVDCPEVHLFGFRDHASVVALPRQ